MKTPRILFIILSALCLALTPAERKLALDAKNHLTEVAKERDAAKSELAQAWQSSKDGWDSANVTNQKAIKAEGEVKKEHEQLEKAVAQNSKMRKVYDACTRWWGIGAILFGISSLFKHIFILTIVLVAVGLVLSIVAPAILPIIFKALGIAGRFFGMIAGLIVKGISALLGSFKKKQE
jgi:hypothetical protein